MRTPCSAWGENTSSRTRRHRTTLLFDGRGKAPGVRPARQAQRPRSNDRGQVDTPDNPDGSKEPRSNDRGQVGGIEVLPFAFLLFASVTLVIANAWGVVDAKLAVTASAREAVRAYVETTGDSAAADAARRRAVETLDAYGRGGSRSTIGEPSVEGPYRRCGRVTVTVAYELPVIAVPFIGGLGHLRPVESTFTEVIDPFRSGLPGTARC